jgi:hypothetical protein
MAYTSPPSPASVYYHLPPDLPETARELRIRLTSGSDPASFDDGTDLMQGEDTWHLPLVYLVSDARYAGICAQLLRGGLNYFPSASVSGPNWN